MKIKENKDGTYYLRAESRKENMNYKQFMNSNTPQIVNFLISHIGVKEFTRKCEEAKKSFIYDPDPALNEDKFLQEARHIESFIYGETLNFIKE